MNKYTFLLILFILITPCAAQATGPFYAGITLGETRVSEWCNRRASRCDDKDVGLKVLGGFQVTPHWGIEAAYIDLGQISYATTRSRTTTINGLTVTGIRTNHVRAEASGFTLSGTGTLPISKNMSIFTKAGLFFWDLDLREDTRTEIVSVLEPANTFGSGSGQQGGTAFTFAAGLHLALTPAIQVRLEWEQFSDIGDQNPFDIQLLSGGMILFF